MQRTNLIIYELKALEHELYGSFAEIFRIVWALATSKLPVVGRFQLVLTFKIVWKTVH